MNITQELSLTRPVIVVGAGGTAGQVARRLKRLQQRFSSRSLIIKVLDNDSHTFKNDKFEFLPPIDASEKVMLYSKETPFADVCRNSRQYPELFQQFVDSSLEDRIRELDQQTGAGQRRIIGRVAYYVFFSRVYDALRQAFQACENIQQRLDKSVVLNPGETLEPLVYVVSSTCGGQGAGCFIDLAVTIRTMTENQFPHLTLRGILTLPSAYKGSETYVRENVSQMEANAHASLTELDLLMHDKNRAHPPLLFHLPDPMKQKVVAKTPLFDTCYLVGGRNRSGLYDKVDDIYEQIARHIWLETASPLGGVNEGVKKNLNAPQGDLFTKDGYGRRYSSLGNFEITYDPNQVIEAASQQMAQLFITQLLNGR